MRLAARLVSAAEVTPRQRDEMFLLMQRHYDNVHRQVFEADLAEKRWVILIGDPDTDRLCGFSTQSLRDVVVAGRPVKTLFSGDTIISREHWGDHALSHTWGRLALALIDAHPDAELYWFLISQGYKTYRFLPVFFREYYPRHDAETPAWARAILDAAAPVPGIVGQAVGVAEVVARHGRHHQRGVAHRARHRPRAGDMGEGAERPLRDAPEARLHADQAAIGGGDADGAAGIGADVQRAEAGGARGAGAAAAAARGALRVPGVAGDAV